MVHVRNGVEITTNEISSDNSIKLVHLETGLCAWLVQIDNSFGSYNNNAINLMKLFLKEI